MTIGIILLTIIVVLGFFGPQVGYILGFFSKHKFEKEQQNIIKPSVPVFSKLPNATKDENISLTGYAQPGYTITLFVNGPQAQKTVVGGDGVFTFSDVNLNNGVNSVFAKATDSSGIESDPTNTFSIIVDKEKPKIDVSSPKDGDTIKNLDKRVLISGKINENADIKINGRVAVQKPDYSFDFLLGVNVGSVEIKIEATDEAGNSNTSLIKIRYQNSSN